MYQIVTIIITYILKYDYFKLIINKIKSFKY